jgi:hypothetical protein
LGFLEDLEKLFNTDASSIYILPTVKPYVLNNKNLRKKYPEQSLQKILSTIENYQVITDELIDDKRYKYIANIERIDSGEKALFSINPVGKAFLVLTGDKNAIIQLCNQSNIEEIKICLTGKIVCLEYILLKLLDLYGINIIGQRMIEREFGGDLTLKLIFQQPDLTIIKCRNGLLSYLTDLDRQTNPLLLTS